MPSADSAPATGVPRAGDLAQQRIACACVPTWPAIGEASTVPSLSTTTTSTVSGRSASAASSSETSLSGDS